MLKGRGKTFAPKKVPLRKPGSTPAPTSSHPGVERPSQTPVPPPKAQEALLSTTEESIKPAPTVIENAVPFDNYPVVTASAQPTAYTDADGANPAPKPQLKGKERQDARSELVQVVAVDNIYPVGSHPSSDPENTARDKFLSDAQTELRVPIDIENSIPPENYLKRKERAPLPSAPPAKRHNPPSVSSSVNTNPPTPETITVSSYAIRRAPSDNDTATHEPEAISDTIHEQTATRPHAQMYSNQGPEQLSSVESTVRNANPAPSNSHHRYPSPVNMVQLVDDAPAGSLPGLGGAGSDIGTGVIGISGVSDVVAMASLNPDGTSGGIIEGPASRAEKGNAQIQGNPASTRRRIQEADDGDDSRATIDMQLNRARRALGEKRARRQRDPEAERRRKERAATPEGASDEEIDITVMTMGDLTKDLKIGKKFSKFAEIKEMEEKKKQEAMRAKMRREYPELAPLLDGNAAPSELQPNSATQEQQSNSGPNVPAAEGREASPERPMGVVSGPQMRVLNGALILDESSLTIDRQANANMEREAMETVEENDFTRVVTQGTYMKREPARSWDSAANQLFYKGLKQFGTDFQMIASMFPHRNRRQIKLKFNKEEKVNAAKINRILMNPKEPINLDDFEKMSNKKLVSLEVLDAETAKFDAEQREEIEKYAEAAAEATRKKKESIKGSEAARKILANESDDSDSGDGFGIGPGGGSNKENNGKGKRKKVAPKKRRGKNFDDDPGEIVGTID
jgi:transcription factor TFIIIB component B''